jgi:hypothetical protein
MAQDKLDILYDALERDGAVTSGRENFRAKMLAPGEEGYKNRLALFTALKQDNAVESNTYEEFAANLGLHAVKPAKQEDPAEEQGRAAQPNADDYARAAKNNALAVARGRDVLHQAENAQEWQKANFGLNVPKIELGLGKSGRTVATAPTFNAKTGKQERTYITQSGNEYTSQASAEREQAALDKQQEQARKLAHVQEEIDRKRQEELAGIDKQLTVMQEQYDRIKGTDHTSETRKGYIMQAIDRLQQQRDAAEKKYRGRDVKAEYELGGGREQLEAAKEEVAKALEDIEERRGEKSGFMEFAESQFPNVTSYIRRWTDPEYGKAKAAEQALEDTENTIKQATREGFSNNTAFNVARGAWDATRDIRTWDFGANDWADSRNLAELVDKSERIRKAEEAGKTPEEHLTATEQRVLDAMAVSSTLDANFSEHVPMSYRVGQSVPASAGFAASIYLNPLNGLGAAVEKQVAANAAKGGVKGVLKGAMKTAGKTVMKNVTGAPTMNAAEQSMQRALTVAAVNKYGKWGVRAMNTAGRVIGDGVEALGTTLTTGLPRTMASINERQTGTFIGRVDDSGRIVYDRVEDRETGAKSYLKGGLASYFENQSELVGEYFSPIKNFANLAAKDMPLARSMVERFIASSPKQKASLLAEFRKKAHISGLFGEYAEEVINNLENAVFTGDMNLTGGVFEPKREDYKSEEDYNKAVNDWKGSMFNAETNLETFLSVAAMIMPMAAIEQGQKRYNSYTVKRQLNTSADALRKSLGEETAVPLMTRMREAESIKDICDVYMSVLKDGGLKDSKQARALMDYAGKLVSYQSVNTSDMSGEISANRVQRGYKSAFDAGHEMAADERHNAAVEFDNAAATATEMLGKDFVMAVRDMDLPRFQEILKTLNWEQKKAATDVYLSSVRLSGIMAGAHDRVDEEADKYGNTLSLMSDEDGNAWRGSNLGENEYVVPSSLSDEGSTLVVRDMETGALRMIPRDEAGELTAVNASEETEVRRQQLWEQAKDEVRWNLNHHNKTVQPAVGETVSISMRKSEDEDNETQRFLIVKEDEEGNFYLLPTRMNEAGEEEAISGTPFKATADELLSSQDYVYEQEDAAQRDAERSAVEETTEGGATEETPTDGSSVVIEGTPATEEDAPADTAVPTRSEVAAQLDATEEGRSARAMVDGWARDENDAETIHEWIDIVDESEWDAKTKQLLHDYVDSKDAPDEEGQTGGSSAVVEGEAAPAVESEAAPTVENKATPKIPLDKNGVPQYYKAPVQATVEDLYDGTLDDKEVGEFIEAQIAEADKNVKKLENRKPKVGTDKAKYLASKKKWEDELEDARHKAQYWNDVKAEVERITTPADAQGWEGELNDDNARAAYRAQRKAENGIPTQQEFIADFMASAKIAPESFRKETGGGTLEQKQWAGRIAKEGDSIERLSEKLVDLDNTENSGRFFGGDSAAARDAIIDFLKSGRYKTDQEQEFVAQYNAQRDAYYNERYGMSYEDYIAYSEQEMPEMLRRYSNFDEQEFTKLYADEIEEDLRRREEQAKQQNNGTEGNDSAGEEQSDGGSRQVQLGERTDDTRGGEKRADTRAEEDAGDEGAGKPEATQENAGAEAAGGRPANVGGTPELQGDIPSEERVAKREKYSATNEHDSQGNPLNADGTLKLEKVESIDDITDEDFSHPTRNVELPQVPENVGNALGTDGKPVIIKKNIFERNAERHKDLSPSQSRGILFSALYNADLYGQNQKAKRPYNWVVINTKDEKGHNRIVLLEINPSKNAVEIIHWHYVNDKNLGLIKKQAIREGGQVLILPSENSEEVGGLSNLTDGQQVEKNGGELVMLSSKDKVESLSTPQHDLSSDGKGSTKLATEQEKGNIFAEAERLAEEERAKREKPSENKGGALLSEQIATASAEVNTEPTEAQKEAGNYKKGHVQVGTFDITIEQPQGSVRRGTDANGKEWESKMNNTYGYIRGTVGVDGDHIDVFLSNDIDGWDGRKVFVIDQYNPDGSFDEHKVMLGFNDADEAMGDYLANYEQGWENGRRIDVSAVNLEDFEKWIESSKRKTKAFNEYKNVKSESAESPKTGAFGTIYTQFKGKPQEAIAFLLEKKEGEAVDALHHKDIGDIDLVWGKEGTAKSDGFGLAKLAKYHPEVLGNLQEILDAMVVVKRTYNRVQLESETHQASVRLTWDSEKKNWLLTAFEKKNSVSDNTTDTVGTAEGGKRNGTATPQNTVSDGKDKEKVSSEQGNGEKSAGAKLVKGEREATSVRLQKTDNVDVESMAAEHGLDGMWLSRYAEGMRERNSAAAAMALHDLKALYLREHIAEKKALMERDGVSGLLANKRLFEPVEQAIKAKYGDVDVLIEERRKQAEIERGMMEAARKRAEEEETKRQQHLEELSLLTGDEIDERYADALAKGDEATAREMLDEAARRKGYGDAESDYQGVGAWGAPSKPNYETDEARRNAVGEDSPDLNVEDMAAGYSNQPEDIFAHPDKYSQGLPTSKESGKAIQTAIDDIRNGKKDAKIKVYRAVPTTVKEGKLRNGDWVTPSKRYAELHGDNRLEGKYRIIEDEVPASDLWWDSNDVNEWGYDNGKNYRYKNVKNNRKLNDLVTRDDNGNIIPPSKRFNSRKADERYQRGKGAVPARKEEAILRDALIDRMRENGMDVITNEEEGQRVLDEAKNYVIFNGKDAKITDHVRFFRTADGEAYGFTVDGKIYIDPKIANSETPVHEYAHLWASALRQSNAKEWANVVGLMKDTAVWEEVKKRYPELTTDDEIADEVLATYSGRKGAERLRKEMEEATKNGSIFDKAEAMSAMQKIRQALDTFWKSVAYFLHIHYTTTEEVADRVMKDLLDGVDPRMMNDGESVESIRYQHVESKEYESPERANERFNDELDAFKNKSHKGLLHLGRPGAILRAAGIDVESITLSPTVLNRHLNKHAITTDDLKGLAKSIQSPILVYKHGKNSPNIVVVTELDVKGGKLSASFELDSNGEVVKVSNISSIHNKDAEKELLRLYKMGEKDFRNALKWVEKEKMLNWLAPSSYKPSGMQTNEAPFDIAKVIQDFENPKVSDEKVSEDDLYRVVDDKETIERLDAEPKITAYRAMQVIDGKLYSPMAAKVDGELTDSNPYGAWTEAEETLLDFTPEQKAAMEALDKSNEPGNVELIKGKLRYNKQSKNGKGTLQFHLVKGDGSSLWAAYNPYIHSSMSMLNDQFTSAYKRPNIVVVEVEIPESELTSGYRAQNAKNTVGMTEWKAGPVAGQLPGDMARQVMLSRWSKVKRIVPYSEVADQVAATLSTAEEKTGQKVQLPIESFHPELRKELEKRGFEFQHGKYTEETAKRKAWDDLTDEEKQQAYKGAAYMDDAAIEALNSEYRGEWLKREGEGQATDEEVSLANDPVSKMIGKSRYSAGQQVEYAENMRERMTTHAQELAEKLHLINVEIVADGSGFTGKRQKAKGFYNKTTGKITVVIGNHTSMADVEKTILHEAVAHNGLRQLFGEHFDQFLDNVYESCDYKIRQKIDALMEEKGYDQRTATEEYLASLAEDINYETTDPTFWTAIKEAFLDMLHTLGFDYAGPVLTDNELRYILWRSYKNLEEPGSFRSILGTAEDLKMQETLGVGQYETEGKESAAAEDLFREDDISRALNNDSEGAGWSRETMQRAWDDVMSKASFLAKEGYFDYLASVDEFQKLVERATGEKVSDMQNAYKAMLQLSSRNANEMKLFDSAFARPLQRAVYRLIGAVKDFKKGKGLELSWYLISKHGIERNRDMAIRAAMKEKAKESFAEQIHEATAELKEERTQLLTELTRIAAGETSPLGTEAAIKARVKQIEAEIDSIKKHPNKHGLKTEAEFYEDELDNWYRTASFIKEYAEENGWTWRETQEELTRRAADFGADVTEDYSGLSALVEEEEDFTEAAYRRVENYENTHYTDDLWEAIRAMSGYSLEKQRSSGLTTKKYVDDQLRRYDFFVPLRGWADPTAEEMYDYLDGQRSELGNPVKTAKGRKSEADNPLGGLLSVAYRSIASGNKNMALQHFYNLVSAHNTNGLAVIDSMWVENRGTEDAPDWVLATPELTDPMTGGREMSAEEVQAELDRFNADMREKAALGMAIQMKKGTPLPPYRVTQQHARAHQIRLSVGGTNRVITIVGNPRVAMALNGLLNPENSGWPILRKLNNFMAGAFTNYNVSFGGANLARDTAHSNLRAFIGESPAYWWALTKKQNLILGNVANWARMVGMLRKYEAGKPMTGYHERMFKELMDGGGATGYTMIRNQKESTQFMVDMVRDLKNIKRRKLSPMRMFEFFSFLNEAAELVNRFVAYETSREMGRTRERSIDDAKEATLNFNRKGAGAKSLTQRDGAKYRLSNALNYYSQYGRSFIVFFNAHVQGTYQLYRLVKEHPAKFAFAFGAAPVTAAAVALPLFNNLLLPAIYSAVGGDGDDDWGDYYYELSDWERQHNICLRLPKGHGWLKIPLTPELGAMFQVGDVTGASFAGKRDMQASDFAGIMELVAPNNVDFTDAGTAISSLVPSSLQWASHIAVNRDFKGSRLRNDNMFSRYQPEYLKATRSTSATITAMSRALNKVGGGNDERSADNVLDFAPGYVQEMLTGIAGGWASTALAVSDALAAPYLEGGGSEKDYWKGAKGLFDRGGVPVLSRFWISGSGERNAARAKGEYMRTVKPFMGATESEFSLIKRIPRPAALDVRAKEEKLEAAKKSHDLFAIAEAEKSLEAAKANFEEAKKTQRQKLDALQGSERFKAYRDMRGITRYIDYMLRLYKDNDLPDNVVDSLQEANRRLLEVEK